MNQVIPNGAKLTAQELTTVVSNRIRTTFEPNEVTTNVVLAVREVISRLGDFLALTYTLDQIKNQAKDNIEERLLYDPELEPVNPEELSSIQQKVSALFDEIFEQYRGSHLKEAEILTLLEISYKRDSEQNDTYYNDLDVELPLDQIQKQQAEMGCFQLRPIEKEAKTLIIGCGNGRLICSGGYTNECLRNEDKDDSLRHNHSKKRCVTIDRDLGANPTILAIFGSQPVAHLFEGQKFDEIIYEGYWPCELTDLEIKEVRELLSPNGKVILDCGSERTDKTHLWADPLNV